MVEITFMSGQRLALYEQLLAEMLLPIFSAVFFFVAIEDKRSESLTY